MPSGNDISSDWKTLIDFLGGLGVASGKMKEEGTTHWFSPNTGATNESGFSGLPVGYRSTSGSFFSIGSYGNWWNSTENNATSAWYQLLYYDNDEAFRSNVGRRFGFSVRCVKD